MGHSRRQRSCRLVIAASLIGGLLTAGANAQTPLQSCSDPVPESCKRARFLGEDAGCACFVCNPDDRLTRKVVCTKQDKDKRTLLNLGPRPSSHNAPGDDTIAGER